MPNPATPYLEDPFTTRRSPGPGPRTAASPAPTGPGPRFAPRATGAPAPLRYSPGGIIQGAQSPASDTVSPQTAALPPRWQQIVESLAPSVTPTLRTLRPASPAAEVLPPYRAPENPAPPSPTPSAAPSPAPAPRQQIAQPPLYQTPPATPAPAPATAPAPSATATPAPSARPVPGSPPTTAPDSPTGAPWFNNLLTGLALGGLAAYAYTRKKQEEEQEKRRREAQSPRSGPLPVPSYGEAPPTVPLPQPTPPPEPPSIATSPAAPAQPATAQPATAPAPAARPPRPPAPPLTTTAPPATPAAPPTPVPAGTPASSSTPAPTSTPPRPASPAEQALQVQEEGIKQTRLVHDHIVQQRQQEEAAHDAATAQARRTLQDLETRQKAGQPVTDAQIHAARQQVITANTASSQFYKDLPARLTAERTLEEQIRQHEQRQAQARSDLRFGRPVSWLEKITQATGPVGSPQTQDSPASTPASAPGTPTATAPLTDAQRQQHLQRQLTAADERTASRQKAQADIQQDTPEGLQNRIREAEATLPQMEEFYLNTLLPAQDALTEAERKLSLAEKALHTPDPALREQDSVTLLDGTHTSKEKAASYNAAYQEYTRLYDEAQRTWEDTSPLRQALEDETEDYHHAISVLTERQAVQMRQAIAQLPEYQRKAVEAAQRDIAAALTDAEARYGKASPAYRAYIAELTAQQQSIYERHLSEAEKEQFDKQQHEWNEMAALRQELIEHRKDLEAEGEFDTYSSEQNKTNSEDEEQYHVMEIESLGRTLNLSPERAHALYNDIEKATVWDGYGSSPSDHARILSSGRLVINPRDWADPEAYEKAVAGSGASEKEKQAALALLPELRRHAAQSIYDAVQAVPAYREFLDAQPGPIEDKVAALIKEQKRGGIPDLLSNSLNAGGADLARGTLGALAAFTGWIKDKTGLSLGSDYLHGAVAYWGARAQAYATGAELTGAGPVPSFLSKLLRASPSVLLSMAGGPAGIAASATQTSGGTYADAYSLLRDKALANGATPEEAEKQARAGAFGPAIATGIIDAVITHGSGTKGATAAFTDAASRNVIKQTLLQRAAELGIKVSAGFREEALEEALSQLSQGIIAKLTYDPDKGLESIVHDTVDAALTGGTLGGLIAGARPLRDSFQPRRSRLTPGAPSISPPTIPTPRPVHPAPSISGNPPTPPRSASLAPAPTPSLPPPTAPSPVPASPPLRVSDPSLAAPSSPVNPSNPTPSANPAGQGSTAPSTATAAFPPLPVSAPSSTPPPKAWTALTQSGAQVHIPPTKVKTKKAALDALTAQVPPGELINPDTLRAPGQPPVTPAPAPAPTPPPTHSPSASPPLRISGSSSNPPSASPPLRVSDSSPQPIPPRSWTVTTDQGTTLHVPATRYKTQKAALQALTTQLPPGQSIKPDTLRAPGQRPVTSRRPHPLSPSSSAPSQAPLPGSSVPGKTWTALTQSGIPVAPHDSPPRDFLNTSELNPGAETPLPNSQPALPDESIPLAASIKETNVPALHEFYLEQPGSRRRTQGVSGSSLEAAAGNVAPAGGVLPQTSAHIGERQDPKGKSDSEQRAALLEFAKSSGLLFDAVKLDGWMRTHYVRGGGEHRLGLDPSSGRVVKIVGVRMIASSNVYEYLTDHRLANLLFKDDITLEGFVDGSANTAAGNKTPFGNQLYIVVSQPWIPGKHAGMEDLARWAKQNRGTFERGHLGATLNVPGAGQISLWDVKPENAIKGLDGQVHPIDFHFYFDDDVQRQQAIKAIEQALGGSDSTSSTAPGTGFESQSLTHPGDKAGPAKLSPQVQPSGTPLQSQPWHGRPATPSPLPTYTDLPSHGHATPQQRQQIAQRVAQDTLQRYSGVAPQIHLDNHLTASGTSGGYSASTDTIHISLSALAAETHGLSPRAVAERVSRVIDEELRHKAHHHAAESLYEQQTGQKARNAQGQLSPDMVRWRDQHYAGIWGREFTPQGREAVLAAYGWTLAPDGQRILDDQGRTIPAWKAAFEGIRMLSQQRSLRATSEHTKLLVDQPQGIIAHLKAMLAYLRDLARQTLSPALEADIAHIENLLTQWQTQSPATSGSTESRSQSGTAQAAIGAKLRSSPVWDLTPGPDPRQASQVAQGWGKLAADEGIFQFKKTQSASATDIADTVSRPGKPVTASTEDGGNTIRFATPHGYLLIKDAATPHPYISSSKANSYGREGGGGAQLYQAALDWIHNNGKTIRDDPSGLSNINSTRRTSNFLSSALRHGTTAHLKPHDHQLVGWQEGKHDFNIGSLAISEMNHVFDHIAAAESWGYDNAHDRFVDAQGREISRDDFKRIVMDAHSSGAGIGVATLQRAILTHAALQGYARETSQEQVPEVVRSGRGFPSGLTEATEDILYAAPPKARQDKPNSWAEVKPGHKWDSSKRFLPKAPDPRPDFPIKRGTWESIVKNVAIWLRLQPKLSDPWGAKVALANPQTKGNFRDPFENRAAHLVGEEVQKGTEDRRLHLGKLDWIGAVKKTIADAQVRVWTPKGETLYFRKYTDHPGMTHMVVVADGTVQDQYVLITQYPFNTKDKTFDGALVDRVRDVSTAASPKRDTSSPN